MKKFLIAFSLFFLLVTGCSPANPATSAPAKSASPTSVGVETSLPAEVSPSLPPTGETMEDVSSPTPDLRLPPEAWQAWPVIPEVSTRARQVYQRGLALGNDPHAFSKIGDCQSVPASFLGIYDTDRYFFAPEYSYLQETVDYYSGSFNREGESVRGGFNTSSVLLPFWANTEVCQPGENPMACENRIHNPSIVFISLEVWFEGRTPDVYEKYLRRIIEYNLEQGTLPILATKADNVEGDNSINYTIARLAYEYDLPLWNYWLAVQPLPNHGLDPADAGGFHLNLDGWNMRSFSALQVLDAVHRATVDLLPEGSLPVTSSADAPTPQVSFTPGPVSELPYVSILPASSGSAPASLLFGYSTRVGTDLVSAGIFQGNQNGSGWLALAGSGMTLLDYSEAGILASQGNSLYLVKDSQHSLITDRLITSTGQRAIFLADGRIAAILRAEGGSQLAIFSEGVPQVLSVPAAPRTLYPGGDPNHIYWGAGQCNGEDCPVNQTISTSLADLVSTVLPYEGQPAVAVDGRMAFISHDAKGTNQLILLDGDQSRVIPFYGNRVVHMQWSPDGSTLAVSVSLVSDYSGLVVRSRLYFVAFPYAMDLILDLPEETIESHAWSPDGRSILLVKRKAAGAGSQVGFSVLDVAAQRVIPALGFDLRSEEYILLQPVFWIP
jgi:hypothetical protein